MRRQGRRLDLVSRQMRHANLNSKFQSATADKSQEAPILKSKNSLAGLTMTGFKFAFNLFVVMPQGMFFAFPCLNI